MSCRILYCIAWGAYTWKFSEKRFMIFRISSTIALRIWCRLSSIRTCVNWQWKCKTRMERWLIKRLEFAYFHSFTCVILSDFQNVVVPNLLHRECRIFLKKKTHFRHSNYLIYNKYDASEGVKVISMHCTKNTQVLQISCYDTSPYPLRKGDCKWWKSRWVFNRKTMSYGS